MKIVIGMAAIIVFALIFRVIGESVYALFVSRKG